MSLELIHDSQTFVLSHNMFDKTKKWRKVKQDSNLWHLFLRSEIKIPQLINGVGVNLDSPTRKIRRIFIASGTRAISSYSNDITRWKQHHFYYNEKTNSWNLSLHMYLPEEEKVESANYTKMLFWLSQAKYQELNYQLWLKEV